MCWKLHRKPQVWGKGNKSPSNKGRSLQVITEPTKNQAIRNLKNPEQPFFTKEQLEHLHSFISQTQISSNPTSSSNLA